MHQPKPLILSLILSMLWLCSPVNITAQDLPLRYATLELFTNTPCPICGSQNPGLFSRLGNYKGEYHLISFYPGQPYSSCIFYQDNTTENITRRQHYSGSILGSPTVAMNGVDFASSSGVTNAVLDNLTGGTSWLHVKVEETTGASREVAIALEDVAGGSLTTGRLYAVIVEREVLYNAPNGETVHHNVFRRFLTSSSGDDVDMSSGTASLTYQYDLDNDWVAEEIYVIAWLSDPTSKEIFNSGTRFDPDFTSSISPVQSQLTVNIYPNPADSEVNISLPPGVTSADVEVYDHQGRVVQRLKGQQGPLMLMPTNAFSPGRYVVRLLADKTYYTGSFEIVR